MKPMNRITAAAALALLLAGCGAGVDQGKVDDFAKCVDDTRPVVREWVATGAKTPGEAALDGLEFCGWDQLTDAEQDAYQQRGSR